MFQPNGTVTLLSDFGEGDGYVGAMKGAALSQASGLRLIDIAHDLPPFDIRRGAYALLQAVPRFPAGTVHVAVVDPGVGTDRAAVIAVIGDQVVVAPDNGLLSLLLAGHPGASVLRLRAADLGLAEDSHTFHGRDLFAPAGAQVASGALALPGPLTPHAEPVAFDTSHGVDGDRAWGVQLCNDRFGNIITSVRCDDIPAADRPHRVRLGPVIVDRFVRTYGEASPGTLVALRGSLGLLEISMVQGDAAALLEPIPGARVTVEPRG